MVLWDPTTKFNTSSYRDYIASFVTYLGHRYLWHHCILTEGGCTHEVVDGLPSTGEPAGLIWHQTTTLGTPEKENVIAYSQNLARAR